MDAKQRSALEQLNFALRFAKDSGLTDTLSNDIETQTIDEFCNVVYSQHSLFEFLEKNNLV